MSFILQIVLLLRLVPLLPFNMLNYLLSVTPIRIGEYMLASWLGMMVYTYWLEDDVLFFFSLFNYWLHCLWSIRSIIKHVWILSNCLPLLHNESWLIICFDENCFCFLLQPITFALVYVGTTLKDLSDVTHRWSEMSTTNWVNFIRTSLLLFFFFGCFYFISISLFLSTIEVQSDCHRIFHCGCRHL